MKESLCEKCLTPTPLNELFSYVDGNNISITKNAPELCIICYRLTYGGKNEIL